jgi:Cu(I)/Ag(I) efflux system membrane fusion protein
VNRTLAAVALAATIAAAVGLGYWAGGRSSAAPSVSANADGAGKPARNVLYYRNPMGLPDTSPVPKKDAMGMDYIPVYTGEQADEAGAGIVTVSPSRVQTLGVRTALAETRNLDVAVRAVGRVEVNERAVYEVSPKFDGWIEKLYVNATGDPVRRGQPLFSVYSQELVSAQKELAIAEGMKLDAAGADPAARESAAGLAAAARERLRNWNVAADGGNGTQRLTYDSPANGIVLEKKAVAGMRFTAGEPVYRIADLSTVWILADVYEQDLARIKVGAKAMVEIDAFPGRHFEARITYLYPTLNAPTRTTPVRIELANRDGLLRPGMFAHVEVATGGGVPSLTVPTSAVIDAGDSQVVLLALGEGRFRPQPVKPGLRGTDSVEIRAGLKEGDRVVVAANFLIDAESNLKAALSNFGGDGKRGDAGSPAAAAKRFHGIGTLDAVDAAGTATITHQPIPELKWPPMTMDFAVARPDLVKGVKLGSSISFEFEQRAPGEYVVTKVEPATGGRANE